MVPGSLVLVGPRLGNLPYYYKCLLNCNKHKGPLLYVSGEEVRLKLKCVRNVSGCKQTDFIFTLKQTGDIVAQVEALKPDYVIIDSIQTMRHPAALGVAGSESHVREALQR